MESEVKVSPEGEGQSKVTDGITESETTESPTGVVTEKSGEVIQSSPDQPSDPGAQTGEVG